MADRPHSTDGIRRISGESINEESQTIQDSSLAVEVKKASRKLQRTIPVRKLIIGGVLMVGAMTTIFAFGPHNKPAQDRVYFSNLQNKVNFQLFYPNPIPQGYVYQEGSAVVAKNILFYNLKRESQVISISEQASPANPPDFETLQKSYTDFTPINTLAGKGIVGLVRDVPVGILLTNTTLINISATKNVPKEAVARVTQNLSSLSL